MEELEAHAMIEKKVFKQAKKVSRREAASPNGKFGFSTARWAMEPSENLLDVRTLCCIRSARRPYVQLIQKLHSVGRTEVKADAHVRECTRCVCACLRPIPFWNKMLTCEQAGGSGMCRCALQIFCWQSLLHCCAGNGQGDCSARRAELTYLVG